MHAAQLEQDAGIGRSNRLARSRSSNVCFENPWLSSLLGA